MASSTQVLMGVKNSSSALQPAPYAPAVGAIDITELAFEIGLLAGHDTVADDEREGHQHEQPPDIVERDGEADQDSEHAHVDRVAREAVWSALDEGGGRPVGGDVRTSPRHGVERPDAQPEREDEHNRADPACGQA